MFVQKVEEFLRKKPGYLKCGASRIREAFNAQSDSLIDATSLDCQVALENVRQEQLNKDTGIKDGAKILIYDIETSYNIVSSWRLGYNVSLPHYSVIKERAIICVSYKWLGEKEVYSLAWDKNQDDKFLLEQFIEVMNEADALVAHNGDKFDIKWIRTRALYHGLEMLPKYTTIDTKKIASKNFYFNSNKLDYITKFLGNEGKITTDYSLWDDIILKKDNNRLQEMIDYCEEDVRQLEKVYVALSRHDLPKVHAGVLQGKDKTTSPISGGRNLKLLKTKTTASGMVKRVMKDLDVNRNFEMSDTNYQKWLKEK